MIRVLSFQSMEVVKLLLNGEEYVPDVSKARENWDYKEDGGAKAWVFHFPNLSKESFYDGSLLQTCRQQMSLNNKWGLTEFYMLELMVDESRVTDGKTHNSCKYVKVMDTMKPEDLIAVYTVHRTSNWYFTQLKPYKIIKDMALFPNGVNPLYYYCWKEYRKSHCIAESLDDMRAMSSDQYFRTLCECLVNLVIKDRR